MKRYKTNQSYQIDDDKYIMFTCECVSGMVGETMEWYRAYLLDTKTMMIHEADYSFLKANYKSIEGRNERIGYWSWMKEFSDEGIKERLERESAEAISRVI